VNYEDLRDYCLSLKGTTECFPFDEVSLVLKVKGKMFALIPLDNPETQIALKCEPERAVAL
jgi:predicted DNA-binding protein (MmcQ/YjbR family)